MKFKALCLAAAAALSLATGAVAQTAWPIKEGDYVARNFKFGTGETLPELRLHYTTLGEPRRDAKGKITNAVMVLHGTGGTGKQFLSPQFAEELYKPGGVLDPAKYYIIMPDNIGHGKSSKPSDGLKAKFPQYDYDDMVAAQHELLTKGLGVDHLRLLFGTSMGCMHGFVWAEQYPTFSQAMMPMACLPTEIAGRNRLWRKMTIDGITSDPAWNGGNYTTQPQQGLRIATNFLILAGSSTIPMQKALPTREATDKFVEADVTRRMAGIDANDFLYQVSSSRNYNPWPKLDAVKVPMTWINSADDFINPPELGIDLEAAKRLPTAKYILIPASENTKGHGSHTWAVLWQDEMKALLERTEK
ncbi:alpha/beta fold hydrolase [Caulobacter sp. 73W]|uniref:Alpha/beta fold hydrolase n=1 Tax=Caulobacter sp. 73W TaxID=3161137 RepID=A0AB39KS15_9CAUL